MHLWRKQLTFRVRALPLDRPPGSTYALSVGTIAHSDSLMSDHHYRDCLRNEEGAEGWGLIRRLKL